MQSYGYPSIMSFGIDDDGAPPNDQDLATNFDLLWVSNEVDNFLDTGGTSITPSVEEFVRGLDMNGIM